jgi:hypothetical protein
MSEPAIARNQATRRPRSRAATRAVWVERLARFPASGQSPAAFCAAEGVSLPSFYSWKRRLTAPPGGDPVAHARGAQTGPRLLPVRLACQAAAVELVLPQGVVVRIGPGCDLAWVRSLVEALGGTPC